MMTDKIVLRIDDVHQWYGDTKVLYDINLHVMQGQFVGVVGPSGCGKSTLLRAILGTDNPKAGTVLVDGLEVTGPNRNVGIVYQDYSETIFDFLTAEENVALGPKLDQTSLFDRTVFYPNWRKKRGEHIQSARDLLVKLRLERALKHHPVELSGGMKQRVAIAQALIMRPKVLLLDEPFSGLDVSTRRELQQMLLVLYQENIEAVQKGEDPPHTVILITHELNEAFYCADRVIGLSRAWTEKVGREKAPPDGLIHGSVHGATKVFDKAAPVYKPDDPYNEDLFMELLKDLNHSVFNPDNPNQDRHEHIEYIEGRAKVAEGVVIDA